MKILYMLCIGLLCLNAVDSFSAELAKTQAVDAFVSDLSEKQVPSTADLATPGILGAECVTARPVLFKVTKASFSKERLVSLAAIAGVQVGDAVTISGEVTALKNSSGSARVGYDSQRGHYYYHNSGSEALVPLSKTDELSLGMLKAKAQKVLEDVLGDQAAHYVFANEETDWFMTKDNQTPAVSRKGFRFTRKVNGRHVVDNTAYFKATFSGEQKLCSFEFTDPQLQPQQLDLMVIPSFTAERLAGWANEKKTTISSLAKEIGVQKINATKAIESFRAVQEGQSTHLIPYISFWATFQIDNGESYDRYIDLCLDASRVPNIDRRMIENAGR